MRQMEKTAKSMVSGKVIIAMKGHPGTGKSTLATAIASSLNFPLIDKDDIKDAAFSLSVSSSSPSPPSSSLINDLSYDAMWRVAAAQLRLGLSVVVDSPLSRRAHLDRLIGIASSAGARLIVVECRPSDTEEWRRRIERRGAASRSGSGGHKPSTWRELEGLMDGYDGCTEYDFGDVPRMVVDTTGSAGVEELVSDVVDFMVTLQHM